MVDFATYCCEKDVDKLYNNWSKHVLSHNYQFNTLHTVYQRVKPESYPSIYFDGETKGHFIEEDDYTTILSNQGINPDNKEADEYTHGWKGPHYWQHHCVNHLFALNASEADYIVLSDADCYIKNQPHGQSWVTKGIEILKSDPSILVVSPSDGGTERKTQIMSQQLFLCERERLLNIDFDLPFEGFKEGGPFAEYYFMLEGRIGRYMEKHNLFRYVLDSRFRYWHDAW